MTPTCLGDISVELLSISYFQLFPWTPLDVIYSIKYIQQMHSIILNDFLKTLSDNILRLNWPSSFYNLTTQLLDKENVTWRCQKRLHLSCKMRDCVVNIIDHSWHNSHLKFGMRYKHAIATMALQTTAIYCDALFFWKLWQAVFWDCMINSYI